MPSSENPDGVDDSTTSSTTFSTTLESRLFGSGKQNIGGLYVDINCQKGHHYAKYTYISNGTRTRKGRDGKSGHIGTLLDAVRAGHSDRVEAFIQRHYHRCGYRGVFDRDIEKFGLGEISPALVPVGWLPGKLAGSEKGTGSSGNDSLEAAEWQAIQGNSDHSGN